MAYAQVIVKLYQKEQDRIYTYRIPEGLPLEVGMMVRVPFGGRKLEGFVIEISTACQYPEEKVREIECVLGREPVFGSSELSMAQWMQKRYYASLSACLALFVPKDPEKMVRMRKRVCLRMPMEEMKRLGAGQKRFLESVQAHPEWELPRHLKESALGSASLRSMQEKGWIGCWEEPEGVPAAPVILPDAEKPDLNQEQSAAVQAVTDAMHRGERRTFLLYGITGSGKTEVYMRSIEQALAMGRGAFLLVPEISLTPQLMERLRQRFGSQVAVLHSRLNDTERSRQWREIRYGAARVVVGPRSALFAPLMHPGLIILDEEHETSYKSDMSPRFHTREVAAEMADRLGIPVVLGSATPSVESYYRAMEGQYTLLRLTGRAVEAARLPEIRLVDMRRELAMGNLSLFSTELLEKIHQCLQRREQVVLFLNRRGHSSFVSCRKCGFVLRCPACYLPYTYHKDSERMICHHCGRQTPAVHICPECGSRYVKFFGAGTQRVEEEVQRAFPEARILRMDANTTGSKNAFQESYEKIRDFQADIIVGTQMIAKGLDMPRVTLVGVLAADMTLFYPDFHSTERTYQLLTQVAGRAGRGDRPGEVLIQTYDPKHYVLKSIAERDDEGFYRQELLTRQLLQCPPYTHLVQILLSGKEEEKVRAAAEELRELLAYYGRGRDYVLLGPAPAELGRIDNMFRWKLMIRHSNEEKLIAYSSYCLDRFQERNRAVSIAADLNPVYMY